MNKFLRDLNLQTRRGTCISCEKDVCWARDRVAAHKRTNCPNASEEEKNFFRKRKIHEVSHSSDNTFDGETSSSSHYSTETFGDAEKQEADRLLALFFYRTGISFRLVDSESFKASISKINPTYAKFMPSAKMLSGTLLDQNYVLEASKLTNLLESSNNLTLI